MLGKSKRSEAGLWSADNHRAMNCFHGVCKNSESIADLSKLAIPALYLPWEMFMGLQAGEGWGSACGSVQSTATVLLLSTTEKTVLGVFFIQPAQTATSTDSSACSNSRTRAEMRESKKGVSWFSRWQRKPDVLLPSS